MTRLAEIQARARSMGELLDIVGAMRALAAMRVQEAQQALIGIGRYAETMAAAIGSAMLLVPDAALEPHPARGCRALVLFAAEHGFVGGFNERLADAMATILKPRDDLFVLGSRGAALALERGWKTAWTSPMATRSVSAPEMVRHLSAELYGRIARGAISSVEVMYARYHQGNAPVVEHRPLLPLDLGSVAAKQLHQPPLHNLRPQALLEKLVAEYVFALLTEAAVHSIVSENGARFAAMESAYDNVTKKLNQVHQAARQARQSEITTELLDIVTGAEALTRG